MSFVHYPRSAKPVALGSDDFVRALLGEQNTGPRFLASLDVIHVQTVYPDGIPRLLFELLQAKDVGGRASQGVSCVLKLHEAVSLGSTS